METLPLLYNGLQKGCPEIGIPDYDTWTLLVKGCETTFLVPRGADEKEVQIAARKKMEEFQRKI